MAASEFNAIDQLAQAYEAEDSQTIIDRGSDDEDTVVCDPDDIDDTVVQNNDSYIDKLVGHGSQKQPHFAASESITMTTSPSFTTKMSSRSSLVHGKPAVSSKPQYTQQPSRDFLIMVENLQKELSTKK